MIAVDESMMAASGCSIDSMVHHLRDFERLINGEIVSTSSKVFYRDREEKIQCLNRAEFKQLVEQGVVDENTTVFNNIIQTLGDLRQGRWEVPMKESWHMDAFGAMV